jgi:hypothetical protein
MERTDRSVSQGVMHKQLPVINYIYALLMKNKRKKTVCGDHVRLSVSVCDVVSVKRPFVGFSWNFAQKFFTKGCRTSVNVMKNRFSDSHALFKGVIGFPLVLSILFYQFAWNSVRRSPCTATEQLWVSWFTGAVKVILSLRAQMKCCLYFIRFWPDLYQIKYEGPQNLVSDCDFRENRPTESRISLKGVNEFLIHTLQIQAYRPICVSFGEEFCI